MQMAKRIRFRQRKGLLIIVVAVIVALVVGGLAWGVWYYRDKYTKLNAMTADQFAQRENDRVIREVGKLYSLPKDEQPSIATIKDKDTVKKQYPFLSEAENGDTLLLYKDKQLAILYRSSSKQLVKVGALNIQDGPTVKVVGAADDRKAVEKALTDNKLTFTTDAPKSTLLGVTVVDVSGQKADQAIALAAKVGGAVGTAPVGESVPKDVDFVIYVGAANNGNDLSGAEQSQFSGQ